MKSPVFFVLLILPFISFAQQGGRHRIDSLLTELSSVRYRDNDTSKVLLLRDVAVEYCLANNDSGGVYIGHAMKMAVALEYLNGQAACLMVWGRHLNYDYNNSLEYYFKALKLVEQEKNDSLVSVIYTEIAGVYYNMKKYPQALEYFKKGKAHRGALGDKRAIAITDLNIGATYGELGDHISALAYEALALRCFTDSRDEKDQAIVYQNMANSYAALKQYNKALAYAHRSMRLFRKLNLEYYHYAGILNDAGYIHFMIAKDSTTYIAPDSLVPAGKNANLAKAIAYLTLSAEHYSIGHTPPDALKKLSDALAAGGRYEEALQLYRQYAELKDKILSKDIQLKIAGQETKREADLKEGQMALNELQVKQKRTERSLYAAGMLGLLVVVGMTVRNTVRHKRMNSQLALEKNRADELVVQKDVLLGQKDMLMKEIHHRVKNNLQVITALMDLQLESIADGQAQKEINEGISRIKSISLIHQQLYQGEQVDSLEFSKFARELANQVGAAFRQRGQHVAITTDMRDAVLDIDTAVPLGLMLNELMTNSYKYAFAGKDGSICIRLEHTSAYYRLLYADSGPGLPEGYDISKGTTLGMVVLDSLSKQLGGGVTYDRNEQRFVIEFKDIVERKRRE